jgi:hypothetical protein
LGGESSAERLNGTTRDVYRREVCAAVVQGNTIQRCGSKGHATGDDRREIEKMVCVCSRHNNKELALAEQMVAQESRTVAQETLWSAQQPPSGNPEGDGHAEREHCRNVQSVIVSSGTPDA